jgi:hypothetical protein
MNHSIYTADRATHLKVVVSVLLASIVIMATTLTVRLAHPKAETMASQPHKPGPSRALAEMTRTDEQPI